MYTERERAGLSGEAAVADGSHPRPRVGLGIFAPNLHQQITFQTWCINVNITPALVLLRISSNTSLHHIKSDVWMSIYEYTLTSFAPATHERASVSASSLRICAWWIDFSRRQYAVMNSNEYTSIFEVLTESVSASSLRICSKKSLYGPLVGGMAKTVELVVCRGQDSRFERLSRHLRSGSAPT